MSYVIVKGKSKKALNDLFSLVNIENKDFELYQG